MMGDDFWSDLSVNAASSAAYTARSTAASAANKTNANQPTDRLDKNAFMRLLLTQMQNEDPLSPVDGQQFFNQLAQLSLLEQMYQLNDLLTAGQQQQQLSQVGSMIGKTVQYAQADGTTASGAVQNARLIDGTVCVTIGDEQVPFTNVTGIDGGS